MRVMSASGEVSDLGGRLLQPEAGRVRPKIFLRRSSSRELSKFLDETDDRIQFLPLGGTQDSLLSKCL